MRKSLLLAALLSLVHVSAWAAEFPCGEPKEISGGYAYNTLVVWQDCEDLTWHVKAYKGLYKGTIFSSDLAVIYQDQVSEETGKSKLALHHGEMKSTIDFDFRVHDSKQPKSFSFAVPLYARMVLVMQRGQNYNVRLGNALDSSGIVNLINPRDVEMHVIELAGE